MLAVRLSTLEPTCPTTEIEEQRPYAFDADLEVELHVVDSPPDNVDPIDAVTLDDKWFGEYDETQPLELVYEDTTPWRRFSSWVRSFKRAAGAIRRHEPTEVSEH